MGTKIRKPMRLAVEDGVELVQLPAGLELAREFVLAIHRPEYVTEMVIELRDGRYGVKSLRVTRSADGPEITGEILRGLTPREDMREGLRKLLKPLTRSKSGSVIYGDLAVAKPPAGIADQGPTDEVLGWAAQTYALARAFNDPPTKSVQEALGVSRATAGRWVAEARKRGLIDVGGSDE